MAEVTIPYTPRPEQALEHDRLKRFNVICAHRRWGKSVFAINQLVQDVLTCPLKDARGAYIAPLLKQAKAVIWDAVKEFTRGIPGITFNESELRADFPNGARIRLYGADNPDSLRGIYLDSVVLDEYAQMPGKLWAEVIRPTLTDRVRTNHKPRMVAIGTPMGKNRFYDLYMRAKTDPDWHHAMHKASESGVLDANELKQAAKELSTRQYSQEFECSFTAAIVGAFYGREMGEAAEQGRITKVPHDKAHPVITAFDIGIRDATAVWFIQPVGRELRCIDYEEYTNAGLPDIIKHLQGKPYNYQQHIGPPDLRVRELGTGMTRLRTAANLGVRFDVAPNQPVIDGIEAVRSILSRCWFDEEKCRQGTEALTQYRNELDDKKGIFVPRHDWTSHGADAMRYFAITPLRNAEWSTELDYSYLNRATGRS